MKPLEILSALPQWAKARPEAIVDSPAFAMHCRLGEEPRVLRRAPVEPAEPETLALSVAFGDEPHTLCVARSSRFPDLDKIWDSRADIPEPVLLALVEKECGPLFQMLENAVRKQMRLIGLGDASRGDAAAQSEDVGQGSQRILPLCLAASAETSRDEIVFSLTRSAAVVSALGVLRNLDLTHEAIRSQTLAAEVEYAAFAMPDSDLASIAPGDAVLLPEVGTLAPRRVVDGRFVVDENGVVPYEEDTMCRVRCATERTVSLGELFDASEDSRGDAEAQSAKSLCDAAPLREGSPVQLRLVKGGKVVAMGRFDRVGDQPALIIESI